MEQAGWKGRREGLRAKGDEDDQWRWMTVGADRGRGERLAQVNRQRGSMVVADEWLCLGEMTGLGWRRWRSWAIENGRLGDLRCVTMGRSKRWSGGCKEWRLTCMSA